MSSDAQAAGTDSLFLHAMWRTGSSYLLSCFERAPGWFTVYEPFNGELGSRRLRERALKDYEQRRQALRHPAVDGGYFGMFEAIDPASGRPLWQFAHPRLPLHDVYNGLSRQGLHMLQACERVARSRGQRAVFGFCHSGVQIQAMRQALGGRHLYLSREPRDQFYSYSPFSNDFFIAATVLQVLATPRLRAILRPCLPRLPLPRLTQAAIGQLPHRLTMRWGRQLWQQLPLPLQYQCFYLTWLEANEAGQADCILHFSLADLHARPGLRQRVSDSLGVSLDGLSYRQNPVDELGLNFAHLERQVESWRAAMPQVTPVATTDVAR